MSASASTSDTSAEPELSFKPNTWIKFCATETSNTNMCIKYRFLSHSKSTEFIITDTKKVFCQVASDDDFASICSMQLPTENPKSQFLENLHDAVLSEDSELKLEETEAENRYNLELTAFFQGMASTFTFALTDLGGEGVYLHITMPMLISLNYTAAQKKYFYELVVQKDKEISNLIADFEIKCRHTLPFSQRIMDAELPLVVSTELLVNPVSLLDDDVVASLSQICGAMDRLFLFDAKIKKESSPPETELKTSSDEVPSMPKKVKKEREPLPGVLTAAARKEMAPTKAKIQEI